MAQPVQRRRHQKPAQLSRLAPRPRSLGRSTHPAKLDQRRHRQRAISTDNAIRVNAARTSDFVFPGAKGTGSRTDLKKPWRAIQRYTGLEGVRIHDLRHTFASIGAGANLGLPVVGRLLGHSQPATTARYAHLDADPLRKASQSARPQRPSEAAQSRRRRGFRLSSRP